MIISLKGSRFLVESIDDELGFRVYVYKSGNGELKREDITNKLREDKGLIDELLDDLVYAVTDLLKKIKEGAEDENSD